MGEHAHEPQYCSLEDIATVGPDTPEKFIADCREYFRHFVQPIRGTSDAMTCFHCDEPLTGFASLLIGKGGFRWGLAHGEGFCANCKWPARAHHFVKDAGGEDLFTLRNFVLQYHPDFVEVSPPHQASTP